MKKFTDSIKQFRDSLLTGDLSILGPMDKLKAAQSQFDADVAKALTGDAEAQGRIQQEAQALLTSAKDVYASSAAYAAIFNSTLAKLDSLAGGSVAAGAASSSSTLPAAALSALQGLGIHMASGGIVTGGIPGIDSVPTLLMPGEVVLNTSQVSQMARFASGGMIAGGLTATSFSAANDNAAMRQNFADLARTIMPGFQMLRDEVRELRFAVLQTGKMQTDEVRRARTAPARPGRTQAG